jgi:formate dehydrogenase
VPRASCEAVVEKVKANAVKDEPSGFIDLAAYRAQGGYALLKECVSGQRDVEAIIKTLEDSGCAALAAPASRPAASGASCAASRARA